MGADLYIEKVYKKNQETFGPLFQAAVTLRDEATTEDLKVLGQKLVDHFYRKLHDEGYFRDSYNGTNCLNRLGLSWWADVSEKFVNKQGRMSVTNAKKFLALVDPLPVQKVNEAWLKENHCTVDANNTVDRWNQMYLDGKLELVAFLKKAIELKEPIDCSL